MRRGAVMGVASSWQLTYLLTLLLLLFLDAGKYFEKESEAALKGNAVMCFIYVMLCCVCVCVLLCCLVVKLINGVSL